MLPMRRYERCAAHGIGRVIGAANAPNDDIDTLD